MKKLILAAAIAGVALGASSFFSPYLTLYQMKTAVDHQDVAAFSEHVDIPALREGIKGRMIAAINEQIASSPDQKNNPLAGAGKNAAAMFIGPIVDAAITPASVMAMVKGAGAGAEQANGTPGASGKSLNFSVSYEGWDKVVLRRVGDGEGKAGFGFKRDGLWGWKLASIDLAKPTFNAPK